MSSTFIAHRYHDVCMGHRVYGHEGKCKNLHGHNYRFHFNVKPVMATLDTLGRVIDFSVIKNTLCEWLEANWDHKMLLWGEDPMAAFVKQHVDDTVVIVPFNPTAENIADHFLTIVAPNLLKVMGVYLQSVTVEETRKCGVTVELERDIYYLGGQGTGMRIEDRLPLSYTVFAASEEPDDLPF